MAFIFPKDRVDTGDAIDAQDLIQNQKVMVGEFNGNLDRDNLPHSSITSDMIKKRTFNTFIYDSMPTNTTINVFDKEPNWRSPIASKTFNAAVDGVVIVSCGAHWQWQGKTIDLVTSNFGGDQGYASWRIRVNGHVVGKSLAHTSLRWHSSTYMVGTIPVVAGTVKVDIQVRKYELNRSSDPTSKRPSAQNFFIRNWDLLIQYKSR